MPIDFSDNLFSGDQKIMFYHEWSKKTVQFKAFDISYSETITNDWEEVALPRRINRSYTWSGVIRKLSLGWSMPAWDIVEAKKNLAKCSAMVQMMYPMTDTSTNAITGGNPIWYVGFSNLIHGEGAERAAMGDKSTMLAGFPDNFSWNIIPEDGFIYDDGDAYPKNIKVSMGYTILLDDTEDFGWNEADKKWEGPTHFPWYRSDLGAFE
tara:strand:- start:1039 stop:1665 length:627 start_codon:yes stop_codon:yes gene_type:complete